MIKEQIISIYTDVRNYYLKYSICILKNVNWELERYYINNLLKSEFINNLNENFFWSIIDTLILIFLVKRLLYKSLFNPSE